MKESDLRRTFASVTPDESLIRATIDRVQAQKYAQAANQAAALAAQPVRKAAPYAFVYRLAGVACALLLVLGMGISIGKDATQPPVADSAASYARTHFTDTAAQDASIPMDMSDVAATPSAPVAYDEQQRAEMLARAKALNTDYIIIDAIMSSCYILPADADGSHGCMLSFDQANVIAASQGAGAILAGSTAGTVTVPLARIRCSTPEEQSAVVDAMGSRMCVLIYADGDTLRIDPAYILAE
jgi:hypothetical protein